MGTQRVVTVIVGAERESKTGWVFEVYLRPDAAVSPEPAAASRHDIALSWADYEHWSRGVHPPARVVEALARFLLDRVGAEGFPERFDAARVRRAHPEVDRLLPDAL